jgi:hypothetical protein
MTLQYAKLPIDHKNVIMELSPKEQDFLLIVLSDKNHKGFHVAAQLFHKLLLLQSGDACRHPVQSSDVVGQGGTNV